LRRTYQISQLFGGLTVLENVYLACRGVSGSRFSLLRVKPSDVTMEQAETILKAVKIENNSNRLVNSLSHGEKRQLEIAMALAGAPRFILFDEPAAGLSPTERRELVVILNALPKHIGFILIEHDLDIALRVSEYISMMHNGKVFKEGTPNEIENDQEVQEIYLGGKHG
jgi:branched-chain amino acid transport system ATP-binding protein